MTTYQDPAGCGHRSAEHHDAYVASLPTLSRMAPGPARACPVCGHATTAHDMRGCNVCTCSRIDGRPNVETERDYLRDHPADPTSAQGRHDAAEREQWPPEHIYDDGGTYCYVHERAESRMGPGPAEPLYRCRWCDAMLPAASFVNGDECADSIRTFDRYHEEEES